MCNGFSADLGGIIPRGISRRNLNAGQVLAHDLILKPQTRKASRATWDSKLTDDTLD
jgi:hypothetical protein